MGHGLPATSYTLPGGCRIFFDPSSSIMLPLPAWQTMVPLPVNPALYDNLPLWSQVVTFGAGAFSVSEGRLIAVRQ